MKRRLVTILGVGAVLSLSLSSTPAFSGPLHDAAMAEVQHGIDLCPTGNLDSAMEIFRSIEGRFPGEPEAIGWARYWHSNCLLAGGRRSEVGPLMQPVWGWVTAGEITNPTACFLFGHQYARVLDTSNLLRSVSERTLQFCDQLKDPGVQIEEKSGFLWVFLSRCYYRTREYARAAAAGRAAWEKGEALRATVDPETAAALDVKPLVLAAWGRLEQAKAELAQGNVLLAQIYLKVCADEYSPRQERHYSSEVETVQGECRLELGLSREVRATVLDKLISTDDNIDKGLWLRATWGFSEEAYNRGATEEAIAPMAVARTCYVTFPGWGRRIDLLWQHKIRGHTPNELFIPELQKQMDEGGDIERAAIRIQLAEILAEENRGAEGLALLGEVPSLSTDPRLNRGLRVARVHCESPGDVQAELAAYEEVLAANPGNVPLAEYVIEQVSPYGHGKMREFEFGPWLDGAREILPDKVYRMTKVRWVCDFQEDYDGSLELIEPLLQSGDVETVRRAEERKIALLYQAHREEEAAAAFQDLEKNIVDVARREDACYQVANWITYSNSERAIEVADRILATRESQHWVDRALLVKLSALSWIGRADESPGPFGELASMPPSQTVGEGIVRMGEIYWKHLRDYASARANFECVMSASDEFPQSQARCYEFYAEMEEELGNHERAVEICNKGDSDLVSSDVAGRETLHVIRDSAVDKLK